MTPAITIAKRGKVDFKVHTYAHDPSTASYGREAVERLGVDESRVFKTLVVRLADGRLAVGVLPVCAQLDMKRIAGVLGVKKAAMADGADVQRTTGYVLGGVSPLGQKQRLPTVIDRSAADHPTIYVSAGRRGLEIELMPDDLRRLVNGVLADIRRPGEGGGKPPGAK